MKKSLVERRFRYDPDEWREREIVLGARSNFNWRLFALWIWLAYCLFRLI